MRLQQFNEQEQPLLPKANLEEESSLQIQKHSSYQEEEEGRTLHSWEVSRSLCCNFTHNSYANSTVRAEQTVSFSGEEEGAKDELKVTQNWLNQFHVSGEVGRNFA